MKNAFLVLFALGAALVFAQAAAATVRIVGLPQSGDAAQIQAAVAGWALALPPGDRMMLYDARKRTLIGSIVIPNDPTKSRPERKLAFILPTMAALKKYLAAAAAANPEDGSVIDASPFLDELGPVIADHSSEDVRILLLGEPWFTAPGALEGKTYLRSYPSDGLLLGDRSQSPVGTRGHHDLAGATVDYCYTVGPNAFLNPEHRDRVERAWSLLIALRGGHLTTFSGDLKTCFDRFSQGKAPNAKQFTIDAADARMFYMYRPQDIAPRILNAPPLKTTEPAAPPAGPNPDEAARFQQPGRTTPPSTRTGVAWLGIQWTEQVDLDLYVRCSADAPFLFFGHQASPEGRHNFDYRTGSGNAFETVDLTQPCVDISKAQVFVNFYSGRVNTPIKGVFAIQFDGGIYKTFFTMPALYGNNGAGLSPAATTGPPFWVKIDLAAVLRLNQRRAISAAVPASTHHYRLID